MPHNPASINDSETIKELESLLRIHEETRRLFLARVATLKPGCDKNGLSWISRLELSERLNGLTVKPDP